MEQIERKMRELTYPDAVAFMRGGLFRSRLIRETAGWIIEPPGQPVSQQTAAEIVSRSDVAACEGEAPPQWRLIRQNSAKPQARPSA
jgi:hypothetical protein